MPQNSCSSTAADLMGLPPMLSRRHFCARLGVVAAASVFARRPCSAASETGFRLKFILASCMYGYTDLQDILPEVKKVSATAIDIWPKVHGNQREQLDEMGEVRFAALLKEHGVELGCITQYTLGPFGLQEEMRLAHRLGCRTIVTGARGPKDFTGPALKKGVGDFVEQMKPHLAVAEEAGITIAIENHGNSLIESPDSLKWLAELRPSKRLAIAFAPYHLPQDEKQLSDLIHALGDSITMFYAWQHGMGCHQKLPKEQELLQMPGRGTLDFSPLLAALKDINYAGWTEIFMHPVPRGVPILGTTEAITKEINRSREYLTTCLGPIATW